MNVPKNSAASSRVRPRILASPLRSKSVKVR